MSYTYTIYGKTIRTNIPIHLLHEATETTEEAIIELDIQYGNILKSQDIIVSKNGQYIINLYPFAEYMIDINNAKIFCIARNQEAFFSTFFNIPFSVYAILSNSLLLHASTMANSKGELLCFTGEKGAGKSTLTALLDNPDLQLFSDDTILLTEQNGSAFRGHHYIKLTQDTKQHISTKQLTIINNYNAVGKQYGYIDNCFKQTHVKSIIKIIRNPNQEALPVLKPIESESVKKALFYGNCVGIKYFDTNLLDILYQLYMPKTYNFFTLSIPNSLLKLSEQKNIITATVQKAFG